MGFSSSRLGEVSYSLVVSRGYVRLVRQGKRLPRPRMPTHFAHRDGEWMEVEPDRSPPYGETCAPAGEEVNPDPLDPQVQEATDEAMHPRRGDGGQSARSRMNMRRMFVSLPWELVGPRPALISLTYPGNWQPWVPDGRTWEAHRRAFERRWVRRWGEPLVGVWVKEFQESGRPHLHLYVGLPSAMSDDDFAGLRERTLLRHRLESRHGRYEGRKRTPPVGIGLGVEFGTWLRDAWAEIVGTKGDGWKQQALGDGGGHQLRGVDVAVMFWSDEAEATTDRTKVAQYLAREAGKWRQKQPPSGSPRSAASTGCGAGRSASNPRPRPPHSSPSSLPRWRPDSPGGSTGGSTCCAAVRHRRAPSRYADPETESPPSVSARTRRSGSWPGLRRQRPGSWPMARSGAPGAQPPATSWRC